MSKTLGQVLFGELVKRDATALMQALDRVVTWGERPEDIDHAALDDAQAAAEAVVMASRAESVHALMQSVLHNGDEAAKERAVIEAAKLFLELEPFRYRYFDHDQRLAVDAVRNAVSRLQELEE